VSTWEEFINSRDGDEWLELCNEALIEIHNNTLHRAAEKTRGMPLPVKADGSYAHGFLTHMAGLDDAADLIDPEVQK